MSINNYMNYNNRSVENVQIAKCMLCFDKTVMSYDTNLAGKLANQQCIYVRWPVLAVKSVTPCIMWAFLEENLTFSSHVTPFGRKKQ